MPCEFDVASEWRYRNPVLEEGTLVIGISQSGETRDTVHAVRLARELGARTAAITNLQGTQITREVDDVLYTKAGMEMGVAATKTFTSQVVLLLLLALKLAEVKDTMPAGERDALLEELRGLPDKMAAFLDGRHPIEEIASRHYDEDFFLYLGRHIGLPICLEGALKLKEISYIPTEAYSAGEMKHGPIALLAEDTPVVVVATDGDVYDKIVSNIQEVRARGAAGDRGRDRRQRGHPAPRGRRDLRPADEPVPAGAAGRDAAPAARVPDRAAARPERRPAAEPGQDRHRRVSARRARPNPAWAEGRDRGTMEGRASMIALVRSPVVLLAAVVTALFAAMDGLQFTYFAPELRIGARDRDVARGADRGRRGARPLPTLADAESARADHLARAALRGQRHGRRVRRDRVRAARGDRGRRRRAARRGRGIRGRRRSSPRRPSHGRSVRPWWEPWASGRSSR